MNIKIIHFSDIHFQVGRNVIIKRIEKLFDSIKNDLKGVDAIVIITSGDIAYSGKLEEYKIAGTQFYKYLFNSIKDYTNLLPSFIFVPGNHDLLFDENEETIRKLILKNFSTVGFDDVSEYQIDICCKPQNNYFQFVKGLKSKSNGDVIFDNPLLKIVTFKFGEKIIKFNCFNSAWHSLKKEQIGALSFPIT